MQPINIGIIGGGYMGKAHAVACRAVGAVFATTLRPHLEMVCARNTKTALRYQRDYGFTRSTTNWQDIVHDTNIHAIIIASPQTTHKDIALAAFANKKHVLCEKPLGVSFSQAKIMAQHAQQSNVVHMVGYNYVKTPATQYARRLVREGAIGNIVSFRGEHCEDFAADHTKNQTHWRNFGDPNGALGDLAPHLLQLTTSFMGPITELIAHISRAPCDQAQENTHEQQKNDDMVQIMCNFTNGAVGQLFVSRVATGRKMGLCYEIIGDTGAIRFDQEDQNALWLYQNTHTPANRGFTKILSGPEHPDYLPFCQGPGHGTGYQDQIIIEVKDFLQAITNQTSAWPNFHDGAKVQQLIAHIRTSSQKKCWVKTMDTTTHHL